MKLNAHGSLAMFYRNFYHKTELPTNLCNYFWKIVVALICTPFVWPALVINKIWFPYKYGNEYMFKPDYYRCGELPTYNGFLANVVIFIMGMLVDKILFSINFLYLGWHKTYVNGIVGWAFIIFMFLFVAYCASLFSKLFPKKVLTLEEREKKYRMEYEESENRKAKRKLKWENSFLFLIKKRFQAWKEKNCPIIEWDHNNKKK